MQGRAASRSSVVITRGQRVDLLGNPVPPERLCKDLVETEKTEHRCGVAEGMLGGRVGQERNVITL